MKVIEHRNPRVFWRQWRAARGRHPNYYTFCGAGRGADLHDLVTSFEDRTSALFRQLKAGSLVSVPAETLKLATAAVARAGTVSESWVARVASEAAKLSD
jgi:hypothetical protein